MMSPVRVAPSLLSADFSKLDAEIKDIEKGGAEILHVDVMDGKFVPNITIGPVVLKSIRPVSRMIFDVHLMIDDPIRYIRDFRAAGADWITVHYEACPDVRAAIAAIKACGAHAGLSVKPKTAIDAQFRALLDSVDLVLVMSVEPGFGGQSFMPEVLPKIQDIKKTFRGLVSIDGGINAETAREARRAGVDILVAGTSVFGMKDRAQAIRMLMA